MKAAVPMETEDAKKRLPLTFGLRFLFLATAIIAVLTWSTLRFYDWYFSVPLADAVASFNLRTAADPVERLEPKVTEEEIVAAIESELPTRNVSEQVKAIYRRIARTRRLPHRATLDSTPEYSPTSGRLTVWWITLSVMTGKNTGYSLRIRRTDYPDASSGQAPGSDSGTKFGPG